MSGKGLRLTRSEDVIYYKSRILYIRERTILLYPRGYFVVYERGKRLEIIDGRDHSGKRSKSRPDNPMENYYYF